MELAELRVCVGPNGTDAMIAGQTKLAVFIDGWISEAGPARQPTLVAEPTEPTALAAGPMVGGARGALGLANLLMGPGEGCAGRRAIRGNVRSPRIDLWSWWNCGNVLGQTGPTIDSWANETGRLDG